MRQDLRSALRLITREPAFAAAVVLTLALGIGANTAIFSVVNNVLLRPLEYREPERLVAISEVVPKLAHLYPEIPVNFTHYLDWREKARSFESIAVLRSTTLNITGKGEPEQLPGVRVTAGAFDVFGIHPKLGRAFTEAEERSGSDRVVILSHALWKRRFGADPNILGRKILLEGKPYDVIGVLEQGSAVPNRATAQLAATGFAAPSFYVPIGYNDDDLQQRLGNFNYTAYARLRPGKTAAEAASELDVLQSQFVAGLPEKVELRAKVNPLLDAVVGGSKRGLLVVMGAVAAVLLVLCANLANLWFARGAARRQELAIRVALGAARGRLVQQMMVESLVLALIGGGIGCVLAFGGVDLLVRLAPIDLPRLSAVRLDGMALGFAVALSVIAGLLFGAIPAWRMSRSDPHEALTSATRSNTDSAQGVRTRKVLVALEVALSTVLLIGAGLLIRSFDRLMRVDRGFEIERVLAVDVALPSDRYEGSSKRNEFYRGLLEKARNLPGVQSAALTSYLPFQGETWIDIIGNENDPRPVFQRPMVNMRFVSSDYFQTLSAPLRAGRTFTESDKERKVAVLSESVAKRLFPDQDPVGRKILHNDSNLIEVVGIAADVRSTDLHKDPVNMMYIPYWQRSRLSASLLVRTAGDPKLLAAALRSAVWEIDRDVPVPATRTLVEVMNRSVAQRKFQTLLILSFAVAALALASLGVYGVLAYSVARRRNEIGIRMALGAAAADVRSMVLRQGMMPVLCGLAAGVAASLAAGRVLASMLFQVTPRDPLTMLVVPALLAVVALAACIVPARSATRIDPAIALRVE